MTREEILKNIKMQFRKLMFEGVTTTLTTNDGKTLMVMGEEAGAGVEIYLVDADNNQTPIENGDYILSDGRTLTVTDGKIAEIKEVAPEENVEEVMEEAPVVETAPTAETPDTATIDRLTALEDSFKQLMEMLQGSMSKTEQVMSNQKALTERFEKIAEMPSAEKTVIQPKLHTSPDAIKASKLEEIKELARKMR